MLALIPERFSLMNRTWRVLIVDQARMEQEALDGGHDYDVRGLCDPYDAIIYLNRDLHTCHEDLVHTFWHEVGHALLFAQGHFSRRMHDEKKVDKFGGIMAQFWSTCEGTQHL